MAVSKAKQIIKQLKNNEITMLEVPDEYKHNGRHDFCHKKAIR